MLRELLSYELYLSEGTAETIAKLKTQIPETAKRLAGLNEKFEPYDVR